jgi:O-antigen/teichoic acid export membrane protein
MSSDPTVESLPAAVRRGAPWVIAGQVASQLLSILSLAFLMRLVDREAFGLFGMALPFVLLPRTLATLGLSAAAVQRQTLSNEERSLVFWMQTGIGALVMALTWLSAWPVALFYDVAEVEPLIRWLSGTVLIASLSATHQALLERQLQIARVTLVRLIGQTLGVTLAIVAAWRGWQQDALVVQQYGELLALLAACWIAAPWRPGWPSFSRNAWRELAIFGGFYSLSSLLFVIVQNVDKVLLGLWLGHTPAGQAVVGVYSQAYNLMMRPVYLVTTPLGGLLLPALSRASHDQALFTKLIRSAFHVTALVLLPASVGLYLVAPDLMILLGGSAWREGGILLAALAPIIAVQGWINLCGSVLAARGRSGLLAAGALLVLVMTLQAVGTGYFFGSALPDQPFATALAIAWALSITTTLIIGVPYVAFALQAVNLRPATIFATAIAPLRSAAIMGIAVLLVHNLLPADLPRAIRLGALVLTGFALYAFLVAGELRRVLAAYRGDKLRS